MTVHKIIQEYITLQPLLVVTQDATGDIEL